MAQLLASSQRARATPWEDNKRLRGSNGTRQPASHFQGAAKKTLAFPRFTGAERSKLPGKAKKAVQRHEPPNVTSTRN